MIAKDFEIVKEIFSIVDTGIVDGYDSLRFEVEAREGYIDVSLIVERDGVFISDARTDINNSILYDLVKRLRESAGQRGERWSSFTMSYRQGEQVKTNFKYGEG
ncbi:hypothetical protein [Pseudomonas sp. NyZ201]|uniref:hypothetical protein n=1 Tax=Pseudomonas sp. NyZ201 TaxID=3409857 RepID=UPI003CE76D86